MNDSIYSAPRYALRMHLAVFVAAMSTLMAQIMLTRIFSAIMQYHYAFATISLTMLGMTIGALSTFLKPERFSSDSSGRQLAILFFCFAQSLAYPVLLQALLPVFATMSTISVLANLVVFLPAFVIGGIIVTLILTRGRDRVGTLYAADLTGAALGCLFVLPLLEWLGAINGMLAISCLLLTVSVQLARGDGGDRLVRAKLQYFLLAFVVLTTGNVALGALSLPHISITYQKGANTASYTEWEAWNSYSHITISKPFLANANLSHIAPQYRSTPTEWRSLEIDAGAATLLMDFDGDFSRAEFLKHDMFNSAYHIRPVERVAVIGVGGGRDILSALVHGAKDVLGMEMNRSTIRALTHDYAEFVGNLDKYPGVHIVNVEARSYLARETQKFDLIQVSMIDTWAATAAGAFALTENGLYTADAWQSFLSRLTPQGMLSFSRWYNPKTERGELYRMLSLARETFARNGITDARSHLMALASDQEVTLVVSQSPLTPQEVAAGDAFANENGFRVVLSPQTAEDPIMGSILGSDAEYAQALDSLVFDISPPTDDRPFFFNMAGFWQGMNQLLNPHTTQDALSRTVFNFKAVELLLSILLLVTTLAVLFILVPLWIYGGPLPREKSTYASMAYFLMIGLGFMFLEIAQMSRLMIFLGHPTYALVAVLFSLLGASGIGSLTTARTAAGAGGWRLLTLCLVLVLTGFFTPGLIAHFRSTDDGVRIAVAVALMLPMGFFMGMLFPLGLKRMGTQSGVDIAPWLWAINGAASVFASVAGLATAMFSGTATAFWVGVVCYFAAASIYLLKAQYSQKEVAARKHGAGVVLVDQSGERGALPNEAG